MPKKSVAEQIEAYTKLDRKQKQRIQQLERDIQDANKEIFADKEVLLDEVRTLGNDWKQGRAILDMLLSKQEIAMLQSKAIYNEEKEQFEIDKYIMREKRQSLPKLAISKRASLNEKQETTEPKLSIKCLSNPQ